jgi:predicted membrane protein
MNTDSVPRLSAQVFVGVAVIGLGLIYLLDNLGLIDAHLTLRLWPVLLILFGVLKLAQARAVPGYVSGGALVLLGVVFTIDRLGLFTMHWRTLWPLALIVAGGAVVATAIRARSGTAPSAPTDDDAVINAAAILGGFRRRIASKTFRGGEITAIMGGCDLDLRDASIEGEAVLHVFAMWGGINLRVPDDWTVVLQGMPMLGGFDEKTTVPARADKRLIVRGYAIMGGCEIRN